MKARTKFLKMYYKMPDEMKKQTRFNNMPISELKDALLKDYDMGEILSRMGFEDD